MSRTYNFSSPLLTPAEQPSYQAKHRSSLDRLYALLSICNAVLKNLETHKREEVSRVGTAASSITPTLTLNLYSLAKGRS